MLKLKPYTQKVFQASKKSVGKLADPIGKAIMTEV